MSAALRWVLFLYNLLFLALAGMCLAAAINRPEPLGYCRRFGYRKPADLWRRSLVVAGPYLAVFASMLPKKPGLQQVVIKQSLQGK